MALKFDGVYIPSFVTVNDIRFPVLPEITQNLAKVPSKSGMVDYGNEIGIRTIEVDITVKGASHLEYRRNILALGEWLYKDYSAQFVHPEDDTKYVMAKVSGETVLQEVLKFGQGTIKFICTDPFLYSMASASYQFSPTDDTGISLYNAGTQTTEPKFRIKFAQDTPHFALISDDRFMEFGRPEKLGESIVTELNPRILWDEMSSTASWTPQVSGLEDGTIGGGISSDGYAFYSNDFGSGAEWHGALLSRALSETATDFTLDINLALKSLVKGSCGRITMLLKDASDNTIGKIQVYNANTANNQVSMYVRVGGTSGGMVLFDGVLFQEGDSKFYDRNKVVLSRKGSTWRLSAFSYMDNDVIFYSGYNRLVDAFGIWTADLSTISVHLGQYSDKPYPEVMTVDDIKVTKHLTPTSEDDLTSVFKTGDVLTVDSSNGEIRLNDELFYTALNPSSRFIQLDKGYNLITAIPSDAIDGSLSSVTYQEKFI